MRNVPFYCKEVYLLNAGELCSEEYPCLLGTYIYSFFNTR